jgi:large subunit ribosomal protein L22
MGKQAHPRALSDVQARAVGRNIRVSPRKLNLVAQAIRGKSAEAALAVLTFSPKRIARDVKKILQSAIANAENNHDLDVDSLVVTEASVGRNMVMKRFHARARGRSSQIEKPFAQVTIVVEEKREKKKEAKTKPAATAAAPAPGAAPAKKPAAKKTSAAKTAGDKAKTTKSEAGKKSGKSKEKA